ncbi:MAG: hypothetical protein R3Y05_06220 [bacterium]
MNDSVRQNIRSILRSKLVGRENNTNRQNIINNLSISESTIKGWTSPSSTNIPLADDLPLICEVLEITLYELFGIESTEVSVKEKQLLNAYSKASAKDIGIINTILDIK